MSFGRLSAHLRQQRLVTILTTMGFVDWKLETLSLLAALGALMAIVGTLFPHAGQPLPQWHYGISINTLLSIYAVTFKTALLFVLSNCILQLQWAGFTTPSPLSDLLSYDQASRGVWGSWLWLYQHRLRAPVMSVATVLTILSLGTIACSDARHKQVPEMSY